LKILEHTTNQFKTFRILIDTISSAFWLISTYCISDGCSNHKTFTPVNELIGEGSITLNTGMIKGNFYSTSIDLKNLVIGNQAVLLVREITAKNFEVN
jgi:hypothetical protein